MAQKSYIIDTNVLVHDYSSFYNLLNDDNIIYIPIVVLEELDNLKTKNDQVGVNARQAIRCIEKELIQNNPRVLILECNDKLKPDNQILEVCKSLKEKSPILVSKDICLRTKARSVNVNVEDYKKDKIETSDQYKGIRTIHVNNDLIQNLFNDKVIDSPDIFYENEAIVIEDELNPKNKAISIYSEGNLKLIDNKIEAFGLKPANLEQVVALNFLLDPSVKLVTLSGRAGSGKTLLAIASALEMVLEQQYYNKLTVARPIMPFQQDIGFLPGDIDDKLGPWLMPIVDNLDFLFQFEEQPKNKKAAKVSAFEELKERGVLDICSLTYIRGRSIPKQYIIIDESQQLTPDELRTILTRAGENTKIVLTGDFSQIDNPYLSADTNGLVYCVDKFKDQSIAAHITFSKCERSELATIADEIL